MESISPTRRPVAVLFDWDGTLADTELACFEAYNHVLSALKLPAHSLKQFYEQPHLSIKDSFAHLQPDQTAWAEKLFYDYLRKIHLGALRPLPGTEKLLQWLRGQNIYTAVVSNKVGDCLRLEVISLGWQKYFACTIGSRDTPQDKPSPIPLLAALKHSQIKPGPDVWFIGDSQVDMICAQNAGCTPVAVGTEAAQQTIAPHLLGKDCLGLLRILINLPER